MHSHAYLNESYVSVSGKFIYIYIADMLKKTQAHAHSVKILRFESYAKTQLKWVIS